jgi:antitoxin component YwqK of YwqJK toxin-antitoxin module
MKKINIALFVLAAVLAIYQMAVGQTIKQDTSYYDNRAVLSVCEYHSGKLAHRSVYFRTGELMMRATFDEEGRMHGLEEWFYRSGQVEEVTPYVHGFAHGVCRRYEADGTPIGERLYVESRIVPMEEIAKHFARR